jgi:hypothetical protein
MNYYMHKSSGTIYDEHDIDAFEQLGEPVDMDEMVSLDDYEPWDIADPCRAGTFKEGKFWRACCIVNSRFCADGSNTPADRPRNEIRQVLAGMLGEPLRDIDKGGAK